MQRMEKLLDQKQQLNNVKDMLDKDAPMESWEGMTYARRLVQLVSVELEIEAIEKEKDAL